jgi:hypothetical protein
VRHLPLRARLREASAALPEPATLKRYYWDPSSIIDSVERLAASRPRLRDGSRLAELEGFIFCNMSSPYDAPPIKFKFHLTCDFLVTTSPQHERLLLLHVWSQRQLVPFRPVDAPEHLHLSQERCAELRLPERLALDDAVVLELKLVACVWHCVRRRWDRARPNTLHTVLENIQLQRTGKCDAKFLRSQLARAPALDATLAHVVGAMLRAAGVSAALQRCGPVTALFLPGRDELQRAMAHAAQSDEALAVVAAPLEVQAAQLSALPPDALPLDAVCNLAKDSGWRCGLWQSLRAQDFLLACALPEPTRLALGHVNFITLRPPP